jgi:sugar lactone lactonase YvrE
MRLLSTALSVICLGSPLAAQTHPGQVIRTIPCPSPCPTGLAVKGDRIWLVDRFSDTIYELDRSSGAVRRELDAPCYQPFGLTLDDAGMLWVGADMPEDSGDKLYRLDPRTAEVTAIVPSPVDPVRSLAWQGNALWVGTKKQGLVLVDPADGSHLPRGAGERRGGLRAARPGAERLGAVLRRREPLRA